MTRLAFYAENDLTSAGMTWPWGVKLYKRLGKIDEGFGVMSWQDIADICQRYEHIEQIEVWTHGYPGGASILGERLSVNSLALHGIHNLLFASLHSRVDRNSVFWLRTCRSFSGIAGQQFAKALSSRMTCRVASHTHSIGPLQPGLKILDYGDDPWWDEEEDGEWYDRTAPDKWFFLDNELPEP